MQELHHSLYQNVEEFTKVKSNAVKTKSVEKLGETIYQIQLAHQGASFDLVAKVTLADAYPDKACLFDLSLVSVRGGRDQSSKKGGEKVTEFANGDSVEPVLFAIKREIEDYHTSYCDPERMRDFMISFQLMKLRCCFHQLC